MNNKIFTYDTTLRDGSQAEGISFSKADKIRIAEKLDDYGISYIEGGWPGSNPKDMEFFETMKGRNLKNAKLTAFGSTRRANSKVEDDENIRKLIESETPAVTIFGKSWLLHVKEVLRISREKNREIIADSCAYLASKGREVIFDAEHFFDGYKDNREYALQTLNSAIQNSAETVVLCDTNGGTLPSEIKEICKDVKKNIPENIVLGIHCHNDSGLATANSLVAVDAGARHVQGTINGYGERTGNANLTVIMPSLELKMGFDVLGREKMSKLRELSLFIAELANQKHDKRMPYVGQSSFAHKGGMHVNAVNKNPKTFEHIKPEEIGNRRRILVSDLSGRSNIAMKLREQNLAKKLSPDELKKVLMELKKQEHLGYEYEAAEASFSLLVKKILSEHSPFFELKAFRVIIEKRGHNKQCLSEATVKVKVHGAEELTAAEGDGPVNALDTALRKSLTRFYPEISKMHLRDFKVRILDGDDGTAAKTRVLVESSDGKNIWGTVGVSENIIEASWQALLDSVEYFLYTNREEK